MRRGIVSHGVTANGDCLYSVFIKAGYFDAVPAAGRVAAARDVDAEATNEDRLLDYRAQRELGIHDQGTLQPVLQLVHSEEEKQQTEDKYGVVVTDVPSLQDWQRM